MQENFMADVEHQEIAAQIVNQRLRNRMNIVCARQYDGDAGGYLWAVFPRQYSDDRIRQFFRMHNVWTEGHYQRTGKYIPTMDDCSNYGGAGQYYSEGMSFYRKGSRVLVTQSWGYDI